MQNFYYLIIGGGIAADSAVKGIRKKDKVGTIGLISSDAYPPYDRPPLTKGLWKGEKEETIWRKTEEHNAKLFLSTTAKSIDVKNKTVIDEKGESYSYNKLLLATGGKVSHLPFKADGINYYRTFDDYKKLREQSSIGKKFVVIGGGFIGSEVAAALAMNGKSVTMVFPEDAIGVRVYPAGLSKFLNKFFEQKGITVLHNDGVTGIEKTGSAFIINTTSGKTLTADGVIAGIGIKPDIELAQSAGLKIDNGIVVNEYLQTSEPAIYAAGDIANYYDVSLDRRRRVEHENNSNLMGKMAGENMAGEKLKYDKLPFFYSDLFELGYEAVGILDSRLETVEQWKEPFKEGVIYYLENNLLVGVLLWNTWNQVDNARALITEKTSFDKNTILNKLPK
jgi:3-phenylpropionate/trans-cinnamate dioxygenase ferredoxin reductase component